MGFSSTILRVSSVRPDSFLSALEMVPIDKPAALAMSRIVMLMLVLLNVGDCGKSFTDAEHLDRIEMIENLSHSHFESLRYRRRLRIL